MSVLNLTDTDVLIVGAGPVGLFLANECARRGLRWKLIEMRATQSEHSKALAIFSRTLEIFNMAGIVTPFLEVANRVTALSMIAERKILARLRFEPEGTPYPFVAMVPQDVTEKILVQELTRKGGSVEYATTFVSAIEHDGYVTASVERNGERSEITARFLVGCDGAHSAVRHLLKLPFAGAQYGASFMLADVDTNEVLPSNEMQLCPSSFGPLAIFPMSVNRRRLVATVENAEEGAPPLELVRKIVAQRAPIGIEVNSLRWSSYFQIHHRRVARMHVGRMFIAGDAAHIHSPFGGQGMNTGLQDVWNLVWKLDLAVRGRGNEKLLDSYSEERTPVVKGVIETTHRLTRAMGTRGAIAQALRLTIMPMMARSHTFQRRFEKNLSELGVSYPGSPIIEGSGNRFWHHSLSGGTGIVNMFLLFFGNDVAVAGQNALGEFCNSFCDLVELRRVAQPGIRLLRPDGYVAYEGGNSDVKSALESVRLVLMRQTT